MGLGEVSGFEPQVPETDAPDKLEASDESGAMPESDAPSDDAGEVTVAEVIVAEVTGEPAGPEVARAPVVQPAAPAVPETPVAAAMRELETLGDRDLAEHPDVYQRIHAELQSALATIDNA